MRQLTAHAVYAQNGKTPRRLAEERGHATVVALLEEHGHGGAASSSSTAPEAGALIAASKEGDVEALRRLIEAGGHVNELGEVCLQRHSHLWSGMLIDGRPLPM